ncbi:hypothetical protein LTR97_001790 [Elasticomyces elasticus]|uniref:Myb-like domain-containing protein n=1 Tax=Elasticomyces elasticus TaxID=574655 RepID=A0AAN7VWN5_9PEZI|nr:hypothetical protein LTR97_001790 [Elasticomyces elasticus]
MPGPWNDATDRQLLLSIIHLTNTTLPKWDKVAEMMGDGYTAESTRQHFQKIRKETKTKFGEPGTPVAGKTGKAAKMPKSTGKRKGDHDTAGDHDDEESPSKKPKGESKGKAAEVKAEDAELDDIFK